MTDLTDANWQQEALLFMKSRPPNEDGTIGVTIRPGMGEWRSWLCYFYGKRWDHRATNMKSRGENGYMVPCRDPAEFDRYGIEQARQEYSYRLHRAEIAREATLDPTSSQMTMEQRMAVLGRLGRVNPLFAKFKQETPE